MRDPKELARRIIMGTNEAFAGQIVMEFDLPNDPLQTTQIAEMCGLGRTLRKK
jgi:hypothetical protein